MNPAANTGREAAGLGADAVLESLSRRHAILHGRDGLFRSPNLPEGPCRVSRFLISC